VMSFPKTQFHSSLLSEKKHNKSLLVTSQICMFRHLEPDWKLWLMYVPHLLCQLLIRASGCISLIYNVAYRHLFENGTLFVLLFHVVWLFVNVTLSRSFLPVLWPTDVSVKLSVTIPLSIKNPHSLWLDFVFVSLMIWLPWDRVLC